jgi:predicted transcriptional regulator
MDSQRAQIEQTPLTVNTKILVYQQFKFLSKGSIWAQNKIIKGLNEGITEGVKESMTQIVSIILTEKNIRASKIAEKLNKPYKTLERHISILKQLNAIEYKGSNRACGYEITKEFSALLKDK